jgi:hypothetical protein
VKEALCHTKLWLAALEGSLAVRALGPCFGEVVGDRPKEPIYSARISDTQSAVTKLDGLAELTALKKWRTQ